MNAQLILDAAENFKKKLWEFNYDIEDRESYIDTRSAYKIFRGKLEKRINKKPFVYKELLSYLEYMRENVILFEAYPEENEEPLDALVASLCELEEAIDTFLEEVK